MIINASPLIIFGKIQRIDILKRVYGKIKIAQSVYNEVVEKGLSKNAPDALLIKEHIQNKEIDVYNLKEESLKKAELIEKIHPQIDKGEAETIALAIQENEKPVLIDEKKAREAAKLNGLKPEGSLKTLIKAYQKNIITKDETMEILKQITSTKFRISAEVITHFIALLDKIKK